MEDIAFLDQVSKGQKHLFHNWILVIIFQIEFRGFLLNYTPHSETIHLFNLLEFVFSK